MKNQPNQKVSFEKRTFTYVSASRNFLYKGNSTVLVADACQSLHPNEHFKLYGENGGEVYNSRKS